MTLVKNTIETAYQWSHYLIKRIAYHRYAQDLGDLLHFSLIGTGNPDAEIAKNNHTVTLALANCANANIYPNLPLILRILNEKKASTSWHVRETVMRATSIIMSNNWQSIDLDTRKFCKDIFAAGLDDVKPEVQNEAKAGLILYLAMKPSHELDKIAQQYTKNSDIYAEREKKKRKINKDDTGGVETTKVDKQYMTTILMMSCLILATPYDMPDYLPNLVVSFIRHRTTSSFMKDTVTKTFQLFRASHQDRWDTDFKTKFTSV